MFLYCKWKGQRVDCSKYVKIMKTDDGFCCSINTLDLAEDYVVPEDDSSSSSWMNGASCGYGGGGGYGYSSGYGYSPSPSYWPSTTTTTSSWARRRKRQIMTTTTTPSYYSSSPSGWWHTTTATSPGNYYYCDYNYNPSQNDESVIGRYLQFPQF